MQAGAGWIPHIELGLSVLEWHWTPQAQRVCYSVFDQVEPTLSPRRRLPPPSMPSEDVDARVHPRRHAHNRENAASTGWGR